MTSEEPEGRHAQLSALETAFVGDGLHMRETEWGEMRVGFEAYAADFDDAALLEGLPDDRCQCPHWGYLLSGRMTVRYADREDVVTGGEAYYMAPDHTIAVDAGTVLVEFSPAEEFRRTAEVAIRNAAEMEERSEAASESETA